MGLKIKETADAAGVSVRTLHYYDQIGLLTPDSVSESGYRLYSSENLENLQQILFFRELDFSLAEIKSILNNPGFDRMEALIRQKKMLAEKKKRLDSIISLLEKTIILSEKGKTMNEKELFNAFDTADIQRHKKEFAGETRKRYGGTETYRESISRTSGYSEKDWEMISDDSAKIYQKFISQMSLPPSDPEVLETVSQWQGHISRFYYDCSDETLSGLGELYISDVRFMENIDKAGPGLADFMSRAIFEYCRKNK